MAKNKNTVQPIPDGCMVEYGNMAKETEETVGTSYRVTLTYRMNESNTATITSHNLESTLSTVNTCG